MSSMREKASAFLTSQLHSFDGRSVVYSRDSEEVQLKATVGNKLFKTDGTYGAEYFQARDYLIFPADLILDGSQTEPIAGDQIKETVGGKIYIYEVMAPGGEPCFQYSDPWLRIHTKLVSVEEV